MFSRHDVLDRSFLCWTRWDGDPNKTALVGASVSGLLSDMVGNAPSDPNAADPVNGQIAAVEAAVSFSAQRSFATVPLSDDIHPSLDFPITYETKDTPFFSHILVRAGPIS